MIIQTNKLTVYNLNIYLVQFLVNLSKICPMITNIINKIINLNIQHHNFLQIFIKFISNT